MKVPFRVGQLNTRHSNPVWATLEQMAREEDLDMVLVQEPPLFIHGESKWKGYRLTHASRSPSHVFIMFKENLECSPCNFEGSRVCRVQVGYRGMKLIVISAYIRHTIGDGADQVSRALTRASELSSFIFVGLDSNGHSPLWGPTESKVHRIGETVQ